MDPQTHLTSMPGDGMMDTRAFPRPFRTISSQDAKKRPDYQNAAYNQMRPNWIYVEDVLGGTRPLRKKSSEYLPRNEAEDQRDYEIRVKRAFFYNAYERALDGLVGTGFRKDPILSPDVPEVIRGEEAKGIEGYAEDIDMCGTHLTVFARKHLFDALHLGHSFILVDEPAPPALFNEDGTERDFAARPLTLAEKKELGIRPYWTRYRADDCINWRHSRLRGRHVVTQVTFREITLEADGEFGERAVTRYRVLNPGMFRLYRNKQNRAGRSVLEIESSGPTPLKDVIPVAVTYGHEVEPFVSRPALLSLADLNIEHFQVRSDLRHTQHWASVPILWARGRDTTKQIQEIGANLLIDLEGDNSAMGFAEHAGNAIGGLQAELDRIEERMAVLAMSFLVENKPGNPVTATEKVLNYADKSSKLASILRNCVDTVELCLYWTALMAEVPNYKRKPSGGSWDLQTEAASMIITPEKLGKLHEMVKDHELSWETLWEILKRGGELPANHNAEDERRRVLAQRGIVQAEQVALVKARPVAPKAEAKDNPAGAPAKEGE